ncbi:E3 ubiquitin-protein ligase TRIM36 isoform X2 [Sciurus carolinensis]|uniref:E3 ubiquitin-protein ligase TRIM36 isoform X2 n=1 Tax=Sciurus carolinensis TaxID=30640 RepID=UPI001FB2959E|nr:E3 ubiquitin-protein ligase TRIM36 isoform X2 [Sciurus carolinensis]
MSESGEISEFGYIMELLAKGKLPGWRRGYRCCGKTAELATAETSPKQEIKSGKHFKT